MAENSQGGLPGYLLPALNDHLSTMTTILSIVLISYTSFTVLTVLKPEKIRYRKFKTYATTLHPLIFMFNLSNWQSSVNPYCIFKQIRPRSEAPKGAHWLSSVLFEHIYMYRIFEIKKQMVLKSKIKNLEYMFSSLSIESLVTWIMLRDKGYYFSNSKSLKIENYWSLGIWLSAVRQTYMIVIFFFNFAYIFFLSKTHKLSIQYVCWYIIWVSK